MARIIICPKCNRRNPSNQTQCECGKSLFNIPAISEEVYEKQLAKLSEGKLKDLEETAETISKANSQESIQVVHVENSDNNVVSETTNDTSDKLQSPLSHNNLDSNKNDTSYSDVALIKICPHCGAENLGVAKICKTCKENIKLVKGEYRTNSQNSDNTSSSSTNNSITNNNETCNQKVKTFVGRLSSPDYSYSFDIAIDNPIIQIGREASMSEYLEEHMFTSRIHAEISIVGEKLAIKDLGKPNGTFINNKRISPNTLTLLKCGDKVSLGGKWEDDWKNSQAGCFLVCYDE